MAVTLIYAKGLKVCPESSLTNINGIFLKKKLCFCSEADASTGLRVCSGWKMDFCCSIRVSKLDRYHGREFGKSKEQFQCLYAWPESFRF